MWLTDSMIGYLLWIFPAAGVVLLLLTTRGVQRRVGLSRWVVTFTPKDGEPVVRTYRRKPGIYEALAAKDD